MKKVQKMALTGAIVWGSTLFLTTLAAVYFGYGIDFLKVWMSIYPGYSMSLVGSIVGFVYGFIDMYVGVYIVYWVYRKIG